VGTQRGAAGGRVVLGRRERRAARLAEVPPQQRAPVIRAYLLRWGRRAGSRAVAREARCYFGVSAEASLREIQDVAEHYPVFRIEYAGDAGIRAEQIAPGVNRLHYRLEALPRSVASSERPITSTVGSSPSSPGHHREEDCVRVSPADRRRLTLLGSAPGLRRAPGRLRSMLAIRSRSPR
jgi:hypothetical protein